MPTVFLCHCDGVNGSITFTDSSSRAHVLASLNSAVVSTTQIRFGSGAANFPTSSAGVRTSDNLSDFDFQSGQFTIECWAYLTSVPGVASLVSQFNNTSGGGWFFGSVSGTLALWHYNGAGTSVPYNSGTAMPATGAWHFYAADRDASGTLRLYIDGVVAGSTNAPTFQAAAVGLNIGNTNRAVDGWPGYIDEVRVTKGEALYAGPFTIPTIPFESGSGVQSMAFVANSKYNTMASGALPMMADVSANGGSQCPFSHMRMIGAGTVTFDSGQVVTCIAGVDTVAPVPTNARSITIAGGTPTVQLGQMI